MAVQDRDSFGIWHVTVVPANRSNSDAGTEIEAEDEDTDGEEDDDTDRRFEPTAPRHR